MNESIQLTQQDNGLVVLRFNRPQALNALDLDAMQRFQDVVDSLTQDDTLRVLILSGAGDRAFCSGGDLLELSAYKTERDARHFTRLMTDALYQLEKLPVPVIAAVNGYALGGGSEIALACDMRIVDESVRMGLVQINMGVTPGWGAGQRLLRTVGYARAMELLVKGVVLNAEDVRSLGLANAVAPAGSALEMALEWGQQIAKQPPDVVRGIKRLLQAGVTLTYEQARQAEYEIFPPLWAADAHLEAVEKFLNRRKSKPQAAKDEKK